MKDHCGRNGGSLRLVSCSRRRSLSLLPLGIWFLQAERETVYHRVSVGESEIWKSDIADG